MNFQEKIRYEIDLKLLPIKTCINLLNKVIFVWGTLRQLSWHIFTSGVLSDATNLMVFYLRKATEFLTVENAAGLPMLFITSQALFNELSWRQCPWMTPTHCTSKNSIWNFTNTFHLHNPTVKCRLRIGVKCWKASM